MAPKPQPNPAYLDEHHQRISEFANDYFDDDDERESFVTELMQRRGYTPRTRTEWEPPAEQEKQQGNVSQMKPRPAYFKQSSGR